MTSPKPIIGVLALQGAVQPHRAHIEAAGGEFRAVKTPAQFAEVDAFILPGGESTTMLKLIERFDLWDVLAQEFSKKPVWGICAGSILMAEKVLYQKASSPRQSEALFKQRGSSDASGKAAALVDPVRVSSAKPHQRDDMEWQTQKSFGLLPMTIERNGYGRQVDSHHCKIDGYEVSLIRAPVIKDLDASIEVLAEHEGDPIWVKRGNNMATTFHPEMSLIYPSPMHKAFIDLC